jgi:ribose-phosphate pyrophosphokinase
MILVNGKEIEFEPFPNGETRIIADSFPELGYEIQTVSFKYESDADLVRLMLTKKYIDDRIRYGFHHDSNPELIVYYMPYSRMDRSENYSPFTLKYVANFINSLGFSKVKVIEPHSDVTTALLDNAQGELVTFDMLRDVIKEVDFNFNTDYVFFPDAGASKRYHNLTGVKQLVGHKNRDFNTGKILNLEVVGKLTPISMQSRQPNAIIVDDLTSYGGTFVHSAKALRGLGFEKIYLLVAHAENSVFKGELFDHIDKLFCTDSIISEQNNWNNAKFKEQLKIYEIEKLLKN